MITKTKPKQKTLTQSLHHNMHILTYGGEDYNCHTAHAGVSSI